MAGCCGENNNFDGLSKAYIRVLWWVIAINATMFVIEMIARVNAQSRALQADALDFLGDTFTYTMSLWAIGKSTALGCNVALFKGYSLLGMALWIFASTLYQFFMSSTPAPLVMSSIALLAFSANLVSALMLMRYKNGDANVRSVWLCSRNDAIGNLVVLMAASGVWMSGSALPDILVAAILTSLFLSSSWKIIKQAKIEKSQSAA